MDILLHSTPRHCGLRAAIHPVTASRHYGQEVVARRIAGQARNDEPRGCI